MKTTLVIGYGNTLRSDDGAGIRAADLVRDAVPEIDVLTVHQLTPELAETIARYRHVVFIDASAEGDWRDLRTIPLQPDDAPAAAPTHAMTPTGLLNLSRTLFQATPRRSVLVTIPAMTFDPGESLSPFTARKVVECVDWIRNEVKPPGADRPGEDR